MEDRDRNHWSVGCAGMVRPISSIVHVGHYRCGNPKSWRRACDAEKIQEEEFQTAQFIMTDQEKRIWNDIYVKKGDTKVLKNLSQDRLEELDEQLALPLIMNYQMSAMEEKTFEKWWRARWHPEAKITAARMTQRVKAAKMSAARMAIVQK